MCIIVEYLFLLIISIPDSIVPNGNFFVIVWLNAYEITSVVFTSNNTHKYANLLLYFK